MTSSPAISFVIPAYNEAARQSGSLELLLDLACRRRLECQLIVVDDGSEDRTVEVARRFQQAVEQRTDLPVRLIVARTCRQGRGQSGPWEGSQRKIN